MMTRIFQRIRDLSALFFHRFGIHCATHQIRLILISGLVITSLFYPALSIYSSSRFKPLSHVPAQLLGILSPGTPSLAYFQDDLDNVWSGLSALRVWQDAVTRARCGVERTIRLERLLVTSTAIEDTGVINKQTLSSTLQFEDELTRHLSSLSHINCLTRSGHECIAISPLEFWAHDHDKLLTDLRMVHTVNTNANMSVAGLPFNLRMVFAGRETSENSDAFVNFATHLSIVYMFLENDCSGSAGHEAWLQALEDVVPPSVELVTKPQGPQLLALQFDPDQKGSQQISGITVLVYLSYILFFVYYSGSMRRMDTVHSRIGLCFTGLVEILVSTITSLSVCAIGGFRITMVPWSVLPIVIVVVGAESMFRLVDEVVKTPISLPVKERIGVGLSRAGTSNTLRVVSYNTILGIIAFFATGAIRQFCVFAIVVLVAHWFLIHTFFVAVLSIDIQRLELDDLLRQGTVLGPSRKQSEQQAIVTSSPGSDLWSRLSSHVKALLKVRLPRNVSLLLLLVFTGALYYTTQPTPLQEKEGIQVLTSRASAMRHKEATMKLEAHPEARRIWEFLNPEGDPLVHIRIEAPAIVMFRPQQEKNTSKSDAKSQRSRLSSRGLRSLWWLFKIIALPIGATIGSLYILLRYLLKGADRLEMHRGKNESRDDVTSRCDVSFDTLPRTYNTDVSFLAASRDCSVIASISAENQLFVWTSSGRRHVEISVEQALGSSSAGPSAVPICTALAISDDGSYLALGTNTGLVLQWAVKKSGVTLLARLSSSKATTPVRKIYFLAQQQSCCTWQDLDQRETDHSDPSVLAFYDNAVVVQWPSFDQEPQEIRQVSQANILYSSLVQPQGSSLAFIAFYFDDGSIELLNSPQLPPSERTSFSVRSGTPADVITHAHACAVPIEGTSHLVFAFATQSGLIILHDSTTGEQITTLEEPHCGSITKLRLVPSTPKACPHCGEVPLCKFYVVFSVGNVVFLERAQLAHRCSCYLSQPLGSKLATSAAAAAMGRRSRSGSFVSSSASVGGDSPPSRTRSRHASLSNASDEQTKAEITASFPVSAHGVHSRRGSDREAKRSSEDRDYVYTNGFLSLIGNAVQRNPNGTTNGHLDVNGSTGPNIWRHLRVAHVKDATCERGGWDIMGQCVIGLRRRSRVKEPSQCSGSYPSFKHQLRKRISPNAEASLASSTLDRWEVWTFDVGKFDALFSSSPLSTLDPTTVSSNKFDSDGHERMSVPRLSFTRLSPVMVTGSYCLAGFGNTVGVVTVR